MFEKNNILLYGSEIGGFQKYDAIEKVHVQIILGVGRDVNNNVALGECGRLPIAIDTHIRLIKYWCRIVNKSNNRYPKQCYDMFHTHDTSGRTNWASELLLCKYGFSYS
eukprot:TRINITY_DN76192_c0_g1_i1.p1 TRINITY_DN76192_c0_g1~~TRINITY_DN76192_c0_g1_i1.p1  ORF type:complete len:109 (-),score=5.72 TRINITY_DN76192_c0_g1_i1:50-376(-)